MKTNVFEAILWMVFFTWGAKLIVTDISSMYTILGWFATITSAIGINNLLRKASK